MTLALTRKLVTTGLSHNGPGVRLCAIALMARADQSWHSGVASPALHEEPDMVLSAALHSICSGVSVLDTDEDQYDLEQAMS